MTDLLVQAKRLVELEREVTHGQWFRFGGGIRASQGVIAPYVASEMNTNEFDAEWTCMARNNAPGIFCDYIEKCRQLDDRDRQIAELEQRVAYQMRQKHEWNDEANRRAGVIERLKLQNDTLREASQHLHETVNTYWLGGCGKEKVIKAQSRLVEAIATIGGEKDAD